MMLLQKLRKIEPEFTTGPKHNVIVPGTKIVGDINTDENLRIDGDIEGNVSCKGKIIVGAASTVSGNIQCENLELLGQVFGNVTCDDYLVLRKSSRLIGDVKTRVIEVELGAELNGDCRMNPAKPIVKEKEKIIDIKEEELTKTL